jgi:folate-binding protein YgfZ
MLDSLLSKLVANGPFQRAAAPYRLLAVAGPDAAEFLHRLCTQDVLGLPIGGLAPAAFLDAKGKVQVTCLVGRTAADAFVLETQAPQSERLEALLDRYHFTEKLQRTPLASGSCVERIDADGVSSGLVGGMQRDGERIRIEFARRGVHFVRVHGGTAEVGLAELAPEHAECLRMLAGLVRVGVDTEPATLALEADLDDHCSTTKGCYTGQEIVARIHTYGHVNRRLCLLQLAPGPTIAAPQPLHDEDGIAVGRVLHAVPLPAAAGPGRLGFGYLPKDFQAPGTKLALADGAAVLVVSSGA